VFPGKLGDLIEVDALRVAADAVTHDLVEFARKVQPHTMRQMAAMRQADGGMVSPGSGPAKTWHVSGPRGAATCALGLAHGGHLTHGMRLNFSGKLYKVVSYGVRRDTERIDFDQVAQLAREHKPKLVVAGASAYSREIDFARLLRFVQTVRRFSWWTWRTLRAW